MTNLLPTLTELLSDPVGLTNPISPLTMASLQGGGRIRSRSGDNNGDVHTSAGYALLKFDVDQVSNLLHANLNDAGFRPGYLCKLAEKNAGPWLTNLAEVLEARRDRIWKEAVASGAEPRTNYFRVRMALVGTYHHCWNIMSTNCIDGRAWRNVRLNSGASVKARFPGTLPPISTESIASSPIRRLGPFISPLSRSDPFAPSPRPAWRDVDGTRPPQNNRPNNKGWDWI